MSKNQYEMFAPDDTQGSGNQSEERGLYFLNDWVWVSQGQPRTLRLKTQYDGICQVSEDMRNMLADVHREA